MLPEFLYHTTSKSSYKKIQVEGLKINIEDPFFTQDGDWAKSVYKNIAGISWPIFLSKDIWAESYVVLKIKTASLDRRYFLPDVPSLIDKGMYIHRDFESGEYVGYFETGSTPAILKKYEDPHDEMIYFEDLDPFDCFEVTGTIAYGKDISPELLQVV